MNTFFYQALNDKGQSSNGQIQAKSRTEAVAMLQQQNQFILQLSEHALHSQNTARFNVFKPQGLSLALQQQFAEQLAQLLRAGIPLDRALLTLSTMPESARAKAIIEQIRQEIRSGKSLSAALESQHGKFSALYVNLIRAGEQSGSLPENLSRLAIYMAQSAKLKGKLINAMIYPMVLLAAISFAIVFLLWVVVPQFSILFDSLGSALPWYTQALIAISRFLQNYWYMLLATLALCAYIGVKQWHKPSFRLALDGHLLANASLGRLLLRADIAKFSATLATLLGNGVPLLSALNYAQAVLSNTVLQRSVGKASESVKAGIGLAHALQQQQGFPHMALQMIQVGEESGSLPLMLEQVAQTYEQQTEQAITRFMALLVPAITFLMTLIVAFIILAVLLPIYDLTGNLDIN